MTPTPLRAYRLENGLTFSGLAKEDYLTCLADLMQTYALTSTQLSEAAGFSSAMVLRVALGLSASGAKLTGIISDCRAGLVAISALRQLLNAGGDITIYINHKLDSDKLSSDFQNSLKSLDAFGLPFFELDQKIQDELRSKAHDSHAILFGTFNSKHPTCSNFEEVLGQINELHTPAHCIECPPGINPDTGKVDSTPIFAATTLALGLPLLGLGEGIDFCGRIYLSDISIPKQIYAAKIPGLIGTFCSQPVTQIYAAPLS